LAGWLVGWLAGWLVGWLAGWLVGWLVSWLVRLLSGNVMYTAHAYDDTHDTRTCIRAYVSTRTSSHLVSMPRAGNYQ
jgi:hypothetical protein